MAPMIMRPALCVIETQTHPQKVSRRTHAAKRSFCIATKTPPPIRFNLSHLKKLNEVQLFRMQLSGAVSVSHVSVSITKDAEHESITDDSGTVFERTLLMLV